MFMVQAVRDRGGTETERDIRIFTGENFPACATFACFRFEDAAVKKWGVQKFGARSVQDEGAGSTVGEIGQLGLILIF